MRASKTIVLSLALLGVAARAEAALLTISGSTLAVIVGALDPLVVPQDPASILIPVAGSGGFVEPASVFGPATVALPTTFSGFPIVLISRATLTVVNRTKHVDCAGGACGGTGPLDGRFIVNVLNLFNLDIPLDPVGSPGATAKLSIGGLIITVLGQGWTTGLQTLTGITTETPFLGTTHTATFQGYDNRTAGHLGTLSLISAFKVITIGAGAGNIPSVAIQTLRFTGVPEPGLLLLFGAGAVGLALHGRSRLRR